MIVEDSLFAASTRRIDVEPRTNFKGFRKVRALSQSAAVLIAAGPPPLCHRRWAIAAVRERRRETAGRLLCPSLL